VLVNNRQILRSIVLRCLTGENEYGDRRRFKGEKARPMYERCLDIAARRMSINLSINFCKNASAVIRVWFEQSQFLVGSVQ